MLWLFLSLDNEMQQDYIIPLKIENVPDSITLISTPPTDINVSVKGKGSQFMRFTWLSKMPSLNIDFNDFNRKENNSIYVSRLWLDNCLRDYFGAGTEITGCHPDSLRVLYTSSPGRRVPLILQADIIPDMQSTLSGPLYANVDSVTVYAYGDIPNDITSVSIEPIIRSGLRDTTKITAKVKSLPLMRVIPDVVTVTIPVEPLIVKKQSIPIEILNQPSSVHLVLFPSQIEVSYLVGISKYHQDAHFQAYANYTDIHPGKTKLKVYLGATPSYIQNASLHPDSVEFIIQHIQK
ncbi:MAG: YbbR-like domain-containing protein [Muribaculaceae bacterium]|nr:YbbR-like domain-containing protein [Muribaculaceae bacterium]